MKITRMLMTSGRRPADTAVTGAEFDSGAQEDSRSDDQLQDYLLQGVSRTFALTIPQLPAVLAKVVSNGYLLCRIVDTIEDEALLTTAHKRRFCEQFPRVVSGEADAQRFASQLLPLLSERTPPTERELIQLTPRVIRITQSFSPAQRAALETCVRIMAQGMAEFQEGKQVSGLATLSDMDRYCYHVAGVVGEMLTRLFCDYSPEIACHQDTMMALSVSFGQGLQMTNILKDVWEDRSRGACWLPRDVFAQAGFDLDDLAQGHDHPGFRRGLGGLIAITHGHLRDALRYTLLIPAQETGLRNFCLWALGMAILTLRKLDRHRDFRNGREVKITRRSVKATMIATRFSARHNGMLRVLFRLAGLGLPSVRSAGPNGVPPRAGRSPS